MRGHLEPDDSLQKTEKMNLPFTYLFVPGNRPERFDKALASDADAIILDLEDAVSPTDKLAARAAIMGWMAAPRPPHPVVVRINDRQSPWFADDLALLRMSAVRCVMLPKTESADDVAAVLAVMPNDGRVIPLIETARGVQQVDDIAEVPRVQRIAFGTLDYGVDMQLSGDERGMIYPASRIAIASRCANIGSPIAGVTLAVDDEAAVLSDLAFARALGFGAKLCIHPKQVAVVRQAMLPTADEIDWAHRVVAAAEAGQGAVQVDGKMVDRPVLMQAKFILARASLN